MESFESIIESYVISWIESVNERLIELYGSGISNANKIVPILTHDSSGGGRQMPGLVSNGNEAVDAFPRLSISYHGIVSLWYKDVRVYLIPESLSIN